MYYDYIYIYVYREKYDEIVRKTSRPCPSQMMVVAMATTKWETSGPT